MAEVSDILFTTDIIIKNGDIDVGLSDPQHIEHIFKARPGQFYQHPTIGIGIDDELNSNLHKPTFKQKVNSNLEFDNYTVDVLIVSGVGDELGVEVDATRRV